MAPRETENNAYAKFWSDQQTVLCKIWWGGGGGQIRCTMEDVQVTYADWQR